MPTNLPNSLSHHGLSTYAYALPDIRACVLRLPLPRLRLEIPFIGSSFSIPSLLPSAPPVRPQSLYLPRRPSRRSDRRAIGFPNGDPHRATAGPRFRGDVRSRSGVPRSPETPPMRVEVLPRMPPLLISPPSWATYGRLGATQTLSYVSMANEKILLLCAFV